MIADLSHAQAAALAYAKSKGRIFASSAVKQIDGRYKTVLMSTIFALVRMGLLEPIHDGPGYVPTTTKPESEEP